MESLCESPTTFCPLVVYDDGTLDFINLRAFILYESKVPLHTFSHANCVTIDKDCSIDT